MKIFPRPRTPWIWSPLAALAISACADRDATLAPETEAPADLAHYPKSISEPDRPEDAGTPLPHVPGELIAEVAQGWTLEMIHDTWDTWTLEDIPGSPFALIWASSYDDIADEILEAGACVTCEPNYLMETPQAQQGSIFFYEGNLQTEDMAEQYALDRVGAERVHPVAIGAGVKVGIIDTGVDFTHPDLINALSPAGFDFVDHDADPQDRLDGIDQDGDGIADEAAGHGTHVAGIVHAVAPGATLIPVRVLDTEGRGTVFDVALGIRYAASQGAQVINMSFGFEGQSRIVRRFIEQAHDSGVFFTASAGNNGYESPTHFPAWLPEVVSVAATDSYDLKADFSTYGTNVTISAPGQDVISTYLFQGYAIGSGTSMSAPFVAGAGALLIASGQASGPEAVTLALQDASAGFDHAGYAYDGKMGSGRLDVWPLFVSLF